MAPTTMPMARLIVMMLDVLGLQTATKVPPLVEELAAAVRTWSARTPVAGPTIMSVTMADPALASTSVHSDRTAQTAAQEIHVRITAPHGTRLRTPVTVNAMIAVQVQTPVYAMSVPTATTAALAHSEGASEPPISAIGTAQACWGHRYPADPTPFGEPRTLPQRYSPGSSQQDYLLDQ